MIEFAGKGPRAAPQLGQTSPFFEQILSMDEKLDRLLSLTKELCKRDSAHCASTHATHELVVQENAPREDDAVGMQEFHQETTDHSWYDHIERIKANRTTLSNVERVKTDRTTLSNIERLKTDRTSFSNVDCIVPIEEQAAEEMHPEDSTEEDGLPRHSRSTHHRTSKTSRTSRTSRASRLSTVSASMGPMLSADRGSMQSAQRPPRSSVLELRNQFFMRSKKNTTKDFVNEVLGDQSMGVFRRLHARGPFVQAAWNFVSNPDSSRGASLYADAMNPLIFFSVIFSLVQSIRPQPIMGNSGIIAEISIDALLAIDIILRLVFCPNRCIFFQSLYNIIDLVNLLLMPLRCVTLYSTERMTFESDELDIQIILIGLTPVLRWWKLLRRFEMFHLVIQAFRDALDALPVLLYILVAVWLFFSALILFVERQENVESLPTAIWLTIVTSSTVGYGDLVPKESVGKGVCSLLMVISALYMSIPIGIIGNSFTRVWENRLYLLTIQRTRISITQLGYTPENIVSLFERFSRGKSNPELNYEQFRRMMITMRIGLHDDQLHELFEAFDQDAGGTVDAKEFVKAVFPASYFEIYGVRRSESDDMTPLERCFSTLEHIPEVDDLEVTDHDVAQEESAQEPTEGTESRNSFSHPGKYSGADVDL